MKSNSDLKSWLDFTVYTQGNKIGFLFLSYEKYYKTKMNKLI